MDPDDDPGADPGDSTRGTGPSDTSQLKRTHPYEPPARAASDTGHGLAKLVTLEGTKIGATYTLSRVREQIGRRDYNDLVLPSSSVSQHHALVIREEGLYLIEDLGSTNGVIVNGARLPPDSRRRLYHGDNVRIADHLFIFLQESAFADVVREISDIQLDRERIAQEARDIIREAFGSEFARDTAAPSSTGPEE